MGVPKFFRYMSERYPCLSEFVREYQIPEFDNLYLDMNGIIHMCSHPDDSNPHFRITEERLFADIFHYIEVLFRLIKPQKLFFMAIDGVAPRAKMNQQRGRRFRSAKEAEKLERDALKKGEALPTSKRFDSNCITPGTEFMATLHEQLKYFVVKMISNGDKAWRRCKVILSGPETPGEGEHKIMDYIRYMRAQPGYDPNTRHCLYGLDADLIMLGLCTHDPHFSLLREEVVFSKKATKRNNVPEQQRFYLLHLSLMREYLELEFEPLKHKLKSADFQFDMEKIIDDWILMGFLVGNDFIPHLPDLHIQHGALPVLYGVYMEVLPTLDGYINEGGTLNLARFEKFMHKLAELDLKNFEEKRADLQYMSTKTGRKMRPFAPNVDYETGKVSYDCDTSKSSNMDPALAALIQETDELDIDSDEELDASSYSSDSDLNSEFQSFKKEYYKNKLEFSEVTREVMQDQAEGYVRAIQWNLNYYYNGCCSWAWYYPHHYSPYISDIKGFSNLKIDFELGKPFRPFEQLLAVLPSASKDLLPIPYHKLMCDDKSMIKDYYPGEFQTDLNGKRQEWEAVVLVPFIDENKLLKAMEPCNKELNEDETHRNTHGPMLIYEYTEDNLGVYEAPNYFSKIPENHALLQTKEYHEIVLPKEKLIKGAYPGCNFDVFYPGFPTLKHLKFTSQLKAAKVKIFEQPSRGENMILKLKGIETENDLPTNLLQQVVWVGWPHLIEARIVGVSNRSKKVMLQNGEMVNEPSYNDKFFEAELEGVQQYYMSRWGVDFGKKTDVLIHVNQMTGRKYICTPQGRVNLEKQFSEIVSVFPLQAIVMNIAVHDEFHTTFRNVTDLFPVGSTCFSLSHPYYGSMGTVLDSEECIKKNLLKVLLTVLEEPNLDMCFNLNQKINHSYLPARICACSCSITPQAFSRVTGTILMRLPFEDKAVNCGLDLKFNKKNMETPGYTKRVQNTWLYTMKTVEIVKDYINKFPQVFHYLDRSRHDDDMLADRVFGEADFEDKVKELKIWLKSLPTAQVERRICESSVLDEQVIEEITEIVDKLNAEQKQQAKQITMQIPTHLLFKPDIQFGNLDPDKNSETQVFDRIVNIKKCQVPLGLKGTVIAVHKPSNSDDSNDDMYDVLFDEKFEGGNRIFRMHKINFINLTHGKRQMETQTGKPGALLAMARKEHQQQQVGHNFRINPMPNQFQNGRQPNSSSAFVSFNKNVKGGGNHAAAPPPQYKLLQNKEGANKEKQQNVEKPMNMNEVFKQICSGQPSTSTTPMERHVPQDSSNFLKQLLQIDPAKQEQASNFPPKPHFNVGEPRFESFTSKLLHVYQVRGFGCPKYSFIPCENGGKYCAKLKLPDGKIVQGEAAQNKADACELAAQIAFNMIVNKAKAQPVPVPQKFPAPPPDWMFNNSAKEKKGQAINGCSGGSSGGVIKTQVFQHKMYQNQQEPTNLRQESSKNNVPKPQVRKSTPKKNHGGGPNFVPLQAITKRPVRSAYVAGNGANNLNNVQNNERKDRRPNAVAEEGACTKVEEVAKPQQPLQQQNNGSTRKTRKMRIAANFMAAKQ